MKKHFTKNDSSKFRLASLKRMFVGAFFVVAFWSGLSATTYTVGTGGDYATLNAAIVAVNAIATPTDVELQIISDLTETTASTIVFNANVTSLKIYPTGGVRTITTTGTFTISNANVTITGCLDGVAGQDTSLIFTSTNTSANVSSNTNPGITITGASGSIAKNIIITNCRIKDYHIGISLGSYFGNLTITNNSIYNTLVGYYAASMGGIHATAASNISGTVSIQGNYIGGNAPCAKGKWEFSNTSGYNNFCTALFLNMTATNPVTTVNIKNNVIRNITSKMTSSGRTLRAIYLVGSQGFNIDGNTISDLTMEYSASQNYQEKNVIGISMANTGTNTVTNNQIFNFTNNSLWTGYNEAATAGIYLIGAGTYIIKNNIIHDILSAIPYNGGSAAGVPTASATGRMTAGILSSYPNESSQTIATPAQAVIEGNQIYTIKNTNTGSYSTPVAGIYLKASTDAGMTLNSVSKNIVYDIYASGTITAASQPYIMGISIISGNVNCYDNAVSLGTNAAGGAVVGILKYTDATTSNSNFYFNNVYIGGTANSATERTSYAFLRLGSNNPATGDIVKNNIFYNERTGSLSQYSIGLLTSYTTGFSSDNNELYSATSANLGTVTATVASSTPTSLDFATWKTTTGGDASSKNVALSFTNTSSCDLHTVSADLKGTGVAVTGIATDLAGSTRPTPPSVGAYEQIAVTSIDVKGAGDATTITTAAGTLQMSATVSPANAANQSVIWSVTNGTGMATIDAGGLLTAIKNGTVTVRATAQDGSAVYGEKEITISGQPAIVETITVTGDGDATTITAFGGTLQMSAAVSPADASIKTVTWSVTNGTGEATIDANGLLTAVKNGTVTVKAAAQDASGVVGELVITISGQTISVTGITVTGAGNATTISTNGGTLQMSAAVVPANATDASVVWSVTKGTGEATIDANGLLTAVKNGTVTVKATANDGSGVYGEQEITISGQIVLVTGVTVTGAGDATTITTNGGSLQMSAVVAPADATDASVTWSVTNGSGEATIDANGLLTAVKNGTVTVKATANDGSAIHGEKEITISGQIVLVTGVTVTGAGDATTITSNGGSLQMSAVVTPSDATDVSVTWSVTNGTGEATINANGLLTAVKNGTVTVKATAKDGSAVYGEKEITISGQVVLITGITLTGEGGATTITDGGSLQMSAVVTPSDATDVSVTWSVTNGTGEATIDANGLLTAVKNGTVTVKATAKDGSNVSGELEITISGLNTKVNVLVGKNLNIFPNPVERVITIDNAGDVKQYAIISLNGVVLSRGTNTSSKLEIKADFLVPGVYILKVYTLAGTAETTFVKK